MRKKRRKRPRERGDEGGNEREFPSAEQMLAFALLLPVPVLACHGSCGSGSGEYAPTDWNGINGCCVDDSPKIGAGAPSCGGCDCHDFGSGSVPITCCSDTGPVNNMNGISCIPAPDPPPSPSPSVPDRKSVV